MDKSAVIEEIRLLRRNIDNALERISCLEINLGINDSEDKTKVKAVSRRYESIKEILNIILVEADDDNPEDHHSILVIENPNYGELVYVDKNKLEELCNNILRGSIGETVEFPEYIKSNKFAELNSDGDWELKEVSE